MLGEVPSGWTREPLRNVGQFLKCQGGSKKDDVPSGVPVVRYGQLYTRYDTVIREFFTFVDAERAASYTPLAHGDILFAGSGETLSEIGKGAVVLGDAGARGSGDLILLRPSASVDPLFLGYAINSPDAVAQKVRLGQGSSIYHISADRLAGVSIALPPLPEQKKIAAILSSVDEAIQATQAVIDQTRRVKEGLLQDLLTRGIGHTRFKQTEIGEIPEGWEVRKVVSLAQVVAGGTPNRSNPNYYGGSIPWVKSGEVNAGKVRVTEEMITPLGLAESAAKLVPSGSTLIAMYGATAGSVGLLCVEAATNQAVAALIPAAGIDADFLYFASQYAAKRLLEMVQGSGQPNLNGGMIKELKLAVPPTAEQRQICEVLTCADMQLEAADQTHRALTATKSGLLTDLLTGKVRVTL